MRLGITSACVLAILSVSVVCLSPVACAPGEQGKEKTAGPVQTPATKPKASPETTPGATKAASATKPEASTPAPKSAPTKPGPGTMPLAETKAQRDKRMTWWREARFGMFIHWGLYAVPAGEYNGKKVGGIGEWIMRNGQIPVSEYEKFAKGFNPVKFDAKEWVSIAKGAGMKYIVITSKHHDGFCMFGTKLTDYNIVDATPFKRDPLKELADECHRQGIKMCFYHSVLDWHHPDYLPRVPWDKRPTEGASYARYIDHMMGQLRELLTNYGEIGVIWFDGGWEHKPNEQRSEEVVGMIRSLQPGIIINNRIGIPQDFDTPEQTIPATGIPGRDWETCMTMNGSWGYRKDDQGWKSVEDLLRKLVDIASKGGNFLLNVGPTAEGLIPQASVERLGAMGKWLSVNGQSVYGTTASPFRKLPWGRCTLRHGSGQASSGDTLYLHVFDWPKGELGVPGLKNKVTKAYLLADKDRAPLKVTAGEGKLTVALPAEAPDKIDTVVVLEVEGQAEVEPVAIAQSSDGSVALNAIDATVHGETARYESGGGKDNIGFWTSAADWVSWDFTVTKPGQFTVELTFACDKGSEGSEYALTLGDQKLTGKVESTGSWTSFTKKELGKVKLDKAGKYALAVRPTSKPKLAVMNLKCVVLRPVE